MKFDVVLPYCHNGIASKRMDCGKRFEIEYAVKSIRKFCPEADRIFIVGDEPPVSVKSEVEHLQCDNPYIKAKDQNIIHKMLYACNNIPDLSEVWMKWSDDQIACKESHFDDFVPRIVRRYSDWTEQQWVRNKNMDRWHNFLYLTLHRFDLKKAAFWEPHLPCPINKNRWIEMCNTYNWTESVACIDNTLYYNFIEQPIVEQFDHLHIQRNNAKNVVENLKIEELPRFLSWTDPAFAEQKFRDLLNKICFE